VGAVIFPGAPAGASSKNTLCDTGPNANVTVPPAISSTVAGVNRMSGVAWTVAVAVGCPPGLVGPSASSPPHPAASSTAAAMAAKRSDVTRRAEARADMVYAIDMTGTRCEWGYGQ
jgi:hypothetical protein